MTTTMIHPADAALLGWLGYAGRCDSSHDDSLDGFLRHGEALFGAGHVIGDSNLRAAEVWRALAGRGVSLIGASFDPTGTIKVWGPRHAGRRRDLGCRLYAGEPPTPATVSRPGSPAWSRWKRDASAWARQEVKRTAAAQSRFAAERLRLQLEMLWAAPASPVDQPPASGAGGPVRPVRRAYGENAGLTDAGRPGDPAGPHRMDRRRSDRRSTARGSSSPTPARVPRPLLDPREKRDRP
ncbi:MAG TPA: hypothetical protein VIJ51_08170 [Solirubrobacteraceae bacterium]